MAGIGFELQKLSRKGTLTSHVSALGHAAVVAGGPWIFTILSLALIAQIGEWFEGLSALETFRVVVIYAFAISLIVTSPIVVVCTRIVADALYQEQFTHIRTTLLTALIAGSLATAAIVGWLYFVFLELSPRLALPASVCCVLAALLWLILPFCGCVRDYKGITIAFLAGCLIGCMSAIYAAASGFGTEAIVWGFSLGLLLTFCFLTGRTFITFPSTSVEDKPDLAMLASACRFYWPLAVGAAIGAIGLWADKWIMWHSSLGKTAEYGLIHAPLYDSAMFIAYLAILPSLAMFVLYLETNFSERLYRYFRHVEEHYTLRRLEQDSQELEQETIGSIYNIAAMQLGVSVVFILAAPLIVDMLSLQFNQVPIIRFGVLGTFFQFSFLVASSIVLFFDRRFWFLTLQTVFACLNIGFTYLSLQAGPAFVGTGFFAAALVSSVVAMTVMRSTLAQTNYLTFIGNNPSLRMGHGASLH